MEDHYLSILTDMKNRATINATGDAVRQLKEVIKNADEQVTVEGKLKRMEYVRCIQDTLSRQLKNIETFFESEFAIRQKEIQALGKQRP